MALWLFNTHKWFHMHKARLIALKLHLTIISSFLFAKTHIDSIWSGSCKTYNKASQMLPNGTMKQRLDLKTQSFFSDLSASGETNPIQGWDIEMRLVHHQIWPFHLKNGFVFGNGGQVFISNDLIVHSCLWGVRKREAEWKKRLSSEMPHGVPGNWDIEHVLYGR